MTSLAELLEEELEEYVLRLRQVDGNARLQPVVCGPSAKSLQSLFARLTKDGTTDWLIGAGGDTLTVPVLLISNSPRIQSGQLGSCACTWDYAVNARNSYERSLILVEPEMWDRPESIRTATDTLSTPIAFEGRAKSPNRLMHSLCLRIASRINISENLIFEALHCIWHDAQGLDTDKRSGAPWDALSYLTNGFPLSEPPVVAVYRSCGLPSPGSVGSSPQSAYQAVVELAEYLEERGLEGGFEELKATATGAQVTPALEALRNHLQQSAGSGGGFNRLRTLAFRPSEASSRPDWWSTLDEARLGQLLDEVGARAPQARIRLTCSNRINLNTSARGEPVVVRDAADLEITCEGAPAFQGLSISRRVGRRRLVELMAPAPSASPTSFTDPNPPAHDRPLRYQAEDSGARSSRIDLVSLAQLEAPGLVSSPNAARITVPERSGSNWAQEIELESTGTHRVYVYSGPATSVVRCSDSAEAESPVVDGISLLTLTVEEESQLTFIFLDAGGVEVGKSEVLVTVQENVGEAPGTYFEALVVAHQRGRGRPSPVIPHERMIRGLETALLSNSESWHPILVAGDLSVMRVADLNWSDPRLGQFVPQFDPRFRNSEVPEAVRTAREEVRRILDTERTKLVEQVISRDELTSSAEAYLRAYLEWLRAEPSAAMWFDCVAILEAEPNPAAGAPTAGGEPIAMLLSPLHPARLAWMFNAQKLLTAGLRQRCPLAGLLDPNRSPDIAAWPIFRGGGDPFWTTFISVPCEDPYWSLLWNSRMIERLRSSSAASLLRTFGVGARGFEGGFTSAQAKRTLQDVSNMLPARSVLRLGVVGEQEGQSTCSEGIVSWSQDVFSVDTPPSWPRELHVFDGRRPEDQPGNEELANLAEDSDGRVLWYDRYEQQLPANLDAIILDQLGIREPRLSAAELRSPASEGCLIGSRIRTDRDSATWIRETRIHSVERSGEGLTGLGSACVAEIEELASSKNGEALVEFAPNHVAVGNRLDQAGLVVVSSAEIDPACFARNAPVHGSYLWDYELPFADGISEQRVGYYKLAKPSSAVRRTVEAATRLLSANPPPVDEVLGEVSRRGIPILKRLASGGTHARGEIGVLLGARLLQDVFGTQRHECRLPVATANTLAVLVPVDPFTSLFRKVRQSLLGDDAELMRGDILAICVHIGEGSGQISIYITPIEIKFRESVAGETNLNDWLKQASSFGGFLRKLWAATPPTGLWNVCAKGLLAHVLNYGIRVYADEQVTGRTSDEWAKRHESILAAVYSGAAEIIVNEEGRLLAFDTSPSSRRLDLDNDGLDETLVVCRADAKALLERTSPSVEVDQGIESWQLCGSAEAARSQQDGGGQKTSAQAVGIEPLTAPAHSALLPQLVSVKGGAAQPGEVPTHEEEVEAGLPQPTTSHSAIPVEVRERVNRAFDGFIGNRPAVDSLKRDLLRALIERPPHLPKNYLFVGNPSTGKTELARRVASALALPFIKVDGRTVTSREKLFELIDAELQQANSRPTKEGTQYGKARLIYPPLIVFVDEVHLVARAVQESFLTVLESRDRTVVLDDRVAVLGQATHLFATTRSSELDAAFRSRCTEVYLHPYTEAEVAQMLAGAFAAWPPEVLSKIARYGRSVPRIAIELAKELETEALVSEFQDRSVDDHLEEVRRTRGIDENGLAHLDVNYLELLERSGPLGEQRLLSMLGSVDRDRILTEVEPHLVQRLSLVQMTPKGRELTNSGRKYLARTRNIAH